MITKIARKELDEIRYNDCLQQALNYKIYAELGYLDTLTQGKWFCYVWNDYEAVMPVCYDTKWIMKRVIQPTFCQQLGVFYPQRVSAEVFAAFLQELNKNRIKSYQFNDDNAEQYTFKGKKRNNFVLNLHLPYDIIYKKYNSNTKRNLKKLNERHVSYKVIDSFDNTSLQLLLDGTERFQLKEKSKEKFALLYKKMFEEKKAFVVQLYINEQLNSLAFFTHSQQKLYYAHSVITNQKLKKGIMHGIVDYVIKNYSDKAYILDFEGSSKSGIAKFFKGFGAENLAFKSIG